MKFSCQEIFMKLFIFCTLVFKTEFTKYLLELYLGHSDIVCWKLKIQFFGRCTRGLSFTCFVLDFWNCDSSLKNTFKVYSFLKPQKVLTIIYLKTHK